ncbi:6-pyruvoyl trahydropterin synthase family protein [Marinicauda sp. Alg238-R41]|jgi:6-pyruvoyltetrahydropterin/6-carboxytetrahydropterin synthase|uniref:6-pyruvoyl trahydropterin synthase family protein n=1 Tax=Marinicauda sp. Alg238-R41 TaxID=2993447 RepID=UPI0022DFE1C8|nr:6-carboxytetrahydropterin synthase [Marinicauda sp. Alg238-R41]
MSNLRLEISKDFAFDAAHYFEHKEKDHPFSRLHGHSFQGTVTLSGSPAEDSGMVKDFWEIDSEIKALRDQLDHRLLNEVEGLEHPSLEAVALWVFERLDAVLPGLVSVEIRRPSCGEKAVIRRG